MSLIPSGIEYARLNEHLDNLKSMLDDEWRTTQVLEKKVSLSVGSAISDRNKDHSYQDVFRRADKKMYEEKLMIHARDGYTSGPRDKRFEE